MLFIQLPFDLLLDVRHALGVVVKVFVLVGHHLVQDCLVSGLGFRFSFFAFRAFDPLFGSRLRQPGFRPSFGLVSRLARGNFNFGLFDGFSGRRPRCCCRGITTRFMRRGIARCDSGWTSPPKLRKIVRRLSLTSNVNGPNWTTHWLESFQKSFLQRFLHALKVGRPALTLVALRDGLKTQLLPGSSHKRAAVDDPVDHGVPVDGCFHRHHHCGSTPPERVELVGLRFPVVDIVSHHELVFLHTWSRQSGWSNRQVKIGRVKSLCSFLFDLHDLRQVSRVPKMLGSRFIKISSFGGNIAKCQSGRRSTFHRRQTVSLKAGHQDGLLKIHLGHVSMEDLQHASSDCIVSFQDAKLVVSTSWDQVQEHSMGRCPFSKLCSLMRTRGIQSQDFRETKRSAPGWLKKSYLHVSRLFFDLHVNLIATELIHDGENRTLFAIPFQVEGVNGHGVVEVWGLVQSRHTHILGLWPGQTGRTLVSPSHLDIFIGKVSCLHRQNQLGSIGMPKLSMKIGHWLQDLMATDLDELLVLFKVLHLLSRFLDDLHGHQFSLPSSFPCQLHCRVNGIAKSMAKFRLVVLHFLEDRAASHHLDMGSSRAFTTQVHSLADLSWAWSKPCGLSHIHLVLRTCLQLCAAAIQDCFKVALHGVQSWGFEWSCVCRILKSRVVDQAFAVDVDVLVKDQVGLFFQDPQISEQFSSLWCPVVQVLHRRPEATFRRHHDVMRFFLFSKTSKGCLLLFHLKVPCRQRKLPDLHIMICSLKVLAQVPFIHIDFPKLELALMLLAFHGCSEDKLLRFFRRHFDLKVSFKVRDIISDDSVQEGLDRDVDVVKLVKAQDVLKVVKDVDHVVTVVRESRLHVHITNLHSLSSVVYHRLPRFKIRACQEQRCVARKDVHRELPPSFANANWDQGSKERSHHGTISKPEILCLLVDVGLHVSHAEVIHDLVPASFTTNCASGSTVHDCPTNSLADKVDVLMGGIVHRDLVHLADKVVLDHGDFIRDFLDAVGWKPVALESGAMLSCASTGCGLRSCRCRRGRWSITCTPTSKNITSCTRQRMSFSSRFAFAAAAFATAFSFWFALSTRGLSTTFERTTIVIHADGNHRVKASAESEFPHFLSGVQVVDEGVLHCKWGFIKFMRNIFISFTRVVHLINGVVIVGVIAIGVGIIILVVDIVKAIVLVVIVVVHVVHFTFEDGVFGVRLAVTAKHSDQSFGDSVNWHVSIAHRFDLNMGPPRHSRPLQKMPTSKKGWYVHLELLQLSKHRLMPYQVGL